MNASLLPILNPNLRGRYAIWTGPGFAAGKASPSFVPLTAQDLLVAGFNPLDEVSKAHDIAYDGAQRRLMEDLNSKSVSKSEALLTYHRAIAAADRKFVVDAQGMEVSDPWGRGILIAARLTFPVKANMHDAIADCISSNSEYREAVDNLTHNEIKLSEWYARAVSDPEHVGELPWEDSKVLSSVQPIKEGLHNTCGTEV